jgi:tetratricopeptide (TPR) repeat protein
MMRKILFTVILLLTGMYVGVSAQSRMTDADTHLLDECRTLFMQGEYSAAASLLAEWNKVADANGLARTEETRYMQVVIDAQRDLNTAMPAIRKFMSEYPNSVYNNRMLALMGSAHFAQHEYLKAVESFDECDPLLLNDEDCRRLVRHNAISLIRLGRNEEGFLELSILERMVDDPEGDEDLVFYKSYVNYVNGRIDLAKEGFENSLESSHAEEALLYLAELDLRGNGDHSMARKTAEEMIENLEDPYVEAEAERILGEYWFRQGEYAKAQDLLMSYLSADLSSDERHDRYLLGLSCFNNADMDGAIENLSKVVGPDDQMTQNACLHIGLAALSKGEKDMARMSFERASSLPGKEDVREQALYNYAMVIHETAYSPFAESVKSFERFLNEFPKSRYTENVNSYLVDAYLSTPSYDAALASIDKIKSPGASIMAAKMQLLYNKAMDLMAAGLYNDVPELLTSVIALDKYDHNTAVEATFWRGEAYYRLSETVSAEADYRRYLAYVSKVTRNSGLANYGVGYILFDRKDYDKAWLSMRTVIETSSESKVGAEVLADACLRAGDCMFYKRQYNQAKEYYNMAINVNDKTGDYALFQTALVNGLQRNYHQKIQDLKHLVNEYPASAYLASALYEEGRAFQQTDEPEQAVKVFSRIITEFPNTDLARKAAAETALIYYQTDRYDEAIKAYKEVIASYPGSDEARTALVDLKSIYVDKGDVNSYIEYTSTVKGAAPIAATERDSLTYTAAEGLFSRGDKIGALARFSDYVKQFPDGAFAANAWYYQGSIYEEAKDYERAVDCMLHAAAFENSRFAESALDHAASISWQQVDYENAMDLYMRLYAKTTDAERQKRSLYCIVSSAGRIEEHEAVIMYADKALQTQLSQEQRTEVMYFKAKALLSQNQGKDARPILEELSKDTRSQYGAESDYLLSQFLYDSGDKEGAEKVIMAFIKEGTPHMYWLARSFILLSDIYKSQGKDVEARQYLLSLKSNYTENDDIAEMIAARLE